MCNTAHHLTPDILQPPGLRAATPLTASPLHVLDGRGEAVKGVAFVPNAPLLAGGATDGVARIWSLEDGRRVGPAASHAGAVTGLAVADDGRAIVTGSEDGTVRFWGVR